MRKLTVFSALLLTAFPLFYTCKKSAPKGTVNHISKILMMFLAMT